MNRAKRRAKMAKSAALSTNPSLDHAEGSHLQEALRLLGPFSYVLPAFFTLTAVLVFVMTVAYLQAPILPALAMLAAILASIAYWVAQSAGLCEVYSDKIVFKRFLRRTEVPLKGLKVVIGSHKAVITVEAKWIWPRMKEGVTLPLPLTSIGTWTRAYEFLRRLEKRGVEISATGFVPWDAIQPITHRIDYFKSLKLVGLLLVGYGCIAGVEFLLRRMGIPSPNIPAPVFAIATVLFWQLDLGHLILRTPEVTWSRREVSLSKGKKVLWTLPKRELKAVVVERRRIFAGLEMSRLCLITHYSRKVPLTPWSPQMGEEFNLIGLALGWGLEVRLEDEQRSLTDAMVLAQTHTGAKQEEGSPDEHETLLKTLM